MPASNNQQSDVISNPGSNADQKTGDLLGGIKSYFFSGEFSDLTICTVDQEFKVHRVVVCGQSEFFSRLYKGNWVETAENVVRLTDDNPRAIEAMIQFMYGLDYDSSSGNRGSTSPLLFNVNLYQVADKYVVPQLKRRAKEKFDTVAKTCWQMGDFSTAIAEVYSYTTKANRDLRDPLVETSREHIDELRNKDDFRTVLAEAVGFAADLVQNLAQTNAATKYCCPNCTAE
ncbi:hypothetical protein BO78DRAFT_447876 [Aspergillus sclerotiicarbonarius CBS 121057]|uniref:BTB domain-containing protein n=1 Tax=Aspergillus sclerotiicarbonarius (strain CBS 121057 / IBT 28362) TaxID=1448318 RepID=A0A319FEX5_ASPSB|nr:hypothetical protein BO78DRAFT_447876 [Aspergillus sclerotiicarbonarius CBS 121057]